MLLARRTAAALLVIVGGAAFAACTDKPEASKPSWLEPCTAPIDPVVDAPELTFTPEGLQPIRTSSPRVGFRSVVGQMDSTVAEQSPLVVERASGLGVEELFAENEGTDAEYTYSDGDTLYGIAMRQVCEGRIEVRLNEQRDPAAE